VIALWLGHEQVETTHIYLHADMGIKERALAATAPTVATPGRFRTETTSFSHFWRHCDYADSQRSDRPPPEPF